VSPPIPAAFYFSAPSGWALQVFHNFTVEVPPPEQWYILSETKTISKINRVVPPQCSKAIRCPQDIQVVDPSFLSN